MKRTGCFAVVTLFILFGCASLAMAQTSNADLNAAMALHAKGDVTAALSIFQTVAQKSQVESEVQRSLYGAAACLLSLKEYDSAIAQFNLVAQTYPSSCFAGLSLAHAGDCLLEKPGGSLTAAENYYLKCLQLAASPTDKETYLSWCYLGLGRVRFGQGRYAEASTYFEQAIAHAPETCVSNAAADLLNQCLAALSQAGQAAGTGNTAARAYFVLGKLYYEQNKQGQALLYLQHAVADATDVALRNNCNIILGESLRAAGREKEAEGVFNSAGIGAASKDDPEDKALTAQTLQSCMDAKDWKNACSVAERMQRSYPGDIAKWGPSLIHAYLDTDEYEKAIPLCKSMATNLSDPKLSVDALTVLAECMYPLGKGAEAVAYQNDYYRQHPDRKADADWVRARTAHYAENNDTRAAVLLEEFITDYPNNSSLPDAQELLMQAYEASGQRERSVKLALSIVPNASPDRKADLLDRVGQNYVCDKRLREAIKMFKDESGIPGASRESRGRAYYNLGICHWEIGYRDSSHDNMLTVTTTYADTSWSRKADEVLKAWRVAENALSVQKK